MSRTHQRWAFVVVLLIAGVLAACSTTPTPTPTPIPSSTPVPPTATTAATPEATVAVTSAVTLPTEAVTAAVTTAATTEATSLAVTSESTSAVVAPATLASASTSEATSSVMATAESTMMATAESTSMATAASTMAASPAATMTAASTAEATGTAEATAELGSIIDVAKADGHFNILLAAIDKAGLTSKLSGTGPFTVFAPTDDAFNKYFAASNTTEADLLNRSDLADILTYHVAPGKITTTNLQDYRSSVNPDEIVIPTLDGTQNLLVTFGSDGSTILLNGTAKITLTNVQASNGVIDVIDSVLVPPAPSATAAATAGATAESTAAATVAATAAPTSDGSVSFGPIEGTPNQTLIAPATPTGG